MDKKQIIDVVKQFKEETKKTFNPKEVYLYGSFAKGTPHKNSDIDVAFVYDEYNGDFTKDIGDRYVFSVESEGISIKGAPLFAVNKINRELNYLHLPDDVNFKLLENGTEIDISNIV